MEKGFDYKRLESENILLRERLSRAEALIGKFKEMRQAQRRYFKERSHVNLRESMSLEKSTDTAIMEYHAPEGSQSTLFG